MNIEKAVNWHKIVIVQSRGVIGNESVHTNVRIIRRGGKIKYNETDIVETSQIISINPKVPYPYLTLAVKKIINGGENIAVGNGGSEYFFGAEKYDSLVATIKDNKQKLEGIKSMFDADSF